MKTVLVLGSFADSLINFRGSLLRRMAAAGHRVVACAPGASPAARRALAERGVAYQDVPLARTSLNPAADLRTLAALVRLFRAVRPDVVFAYTLKPVLYGLLAARVARVPESYAMITGLGYAFSGTDVKRRFIAAAVRGLYRLSLRGASRVVFQNPDDRELLLSLGLCRGPEQTLVVNGSGVDLDAFRPAPTPPDPSFLLIARLLKDKGIAEYAEAARRIKVRYPDATFRLVGWIDGGPAAVAEDDLRRWVEEGVIDYLGRLDDVRPAIAAAAVYVLPSYYREGTPRTVLEAMAMGRPIVTTDMPGCRQTVEPGRNGFRVPPRDAAALAEALTRFVERPSLITSMGRESRRIAEERYDVHTVDAVLMRAMGLEG